MPDLADAVLQIILKNYSNPQFDVNCLAEKTGKSHSFLREVVHTHYGMGVHELIETIRLERAILLLGADCGLVDWARVKSGYAYSKTFRVAFKKRLRLTPLECKNMLSHPENRQSQISRLLQTLWESSDKAASDFNRRKQPAILGLEC